MKQVTEYLTISLTPELKSKLKEAAKKEERTVSKLATMILDQELKNKEKEQK